jgi:hypothetical protein
VRLICLKSFGRMIDMKNPIQPIKDGMFKENKIVSELFNFSSEKGFDLNKIAQMEFSKDDRQQFAQLIGYSIGGYSELDYVDDDSFKAVMLMLDEDLSEKDARIQTLEHELLMVRRSLVQPISRLFGVHPDDLTSNMPE